MEARWWCRTIRSKDGVTAGVSGKVERQLKGWATESYGGGEGMQHP